MNKLGPYYFTDAAKETVTITLIRKDYWENGKYTAMLKVIGRCKFASMRDVIDFKINWVSGNYFIDRNFHLSIQSMNYFDELINKIKNNKLFL